MNTSLSPPHRPSAKANSTKHQKLGAAAVAKTPPRNESNEDDAVAHSDEGSLLDLLERDFKLTISDDLMTDDDSDIDDEQAAFIGLAHESASSIHPYNIDTKEDSSMCYHPAATLIHENNQMMEQQRGLLDNKENTLEDELYETRLSFSRRPSQLLQENTTLNALCPPSHVLKARRLSKTIMKPSASTPVTVKDKDRRSSISDNYSKELSSHSAVSPRFMALRKLSEVSNLPPHSISYSAVPPVPQIPSASADDKTVPRAVANDDQLLTKIDKMLESQLHFHLGQIVWRASENHLDARRFWEEQKKEMFGLAATLIGQMDTQVVMQKRMAIESTKNTERIERGEANLALLQKELNTYISKYTEAKSQLFELEMLKTRNLQLEKQHEEDLKIITHLKKVPGVSTDEPLADLKPENTQLLKEKEKNQQLQEQNTLLEQEKEKQALEIKQLKSQIFQINQNKLLPSASTTIIADGLEYNNNDSSENKIDNWADIMESEDKAKKCANEWAQKHRELQVSYFELCSKLQKKRQLQTDYKKTIYNLSQSVVEKDEIIRQLKQAQNVDRIQLDYLQMELNNNHEKSKRKKASETGGYTTEGDYLTFTTKINGQPSKYTIKIPNVNHYGNKGPAPNCNTLNSYASEWKRSKTEN
ncbi:hypothetical protein BD408DRAFT_416335 [Parasitella parasitica]|nr:hypothetical protein BD408DRAFT_416335 [Parasitella parasitica]